MQKGLESWGLGFMQLGYVVANADLALRYWEYGLTNFNYALADYKYGRKDWEYGRKK